LKMKMAVTMNKNILYTILFLSFFCIGIAQAEFDPFPENKDSIYYYDNENDVPEICFFGKGARWDGYKVMTKDWGKLTDYQKTMFISEGAEEIERNENVKVIWNDGWDILVAVNGGINNLHKEDPTKEVSIIKFLRDTLRNSGLIKVGSTK